MSYGIKIINPSNELVISSDGMGLYCIGKAVLQGSVVQASGTATADTPGRVSGYSVYRISHPGQIIVAIDLPLNKHVGIKSVTQPSTGVWEITCWCGSSPDAYAIDGTQVAIDVWAFGLPQSAGSTWGMNIYKADGSIAYDLTRSNPLFPRAYVVGNGAGGNVTIPSLTRPVIMGCPTSDPSSITLVSTNTWARLYQRGIWQRTSSTNIVDGVVTTQRFQFFSPEDMSTNDGGVYTAPAFILEGSTLP